MAHHELTTRKTTTHVEAIAIPNEGEYTYRFASRTGVPAHIQPGDGISLTASDGGVFIGEVSDVDPLHDTIILNLT